MHAWINQPQPSLLPAPAPPAGLQALSVQGIYLRCDEALAPLAALTGLTCLEVRGDGETSRRLLPGRLRTLTRLQVGAVVRGGAAACVSWHCQGRSGASHVR
jgi:hypothetical protein